jgi:hypothetical protein
MSNKKLRSVSKTDIPVVKLPEECCAKCRLFLPQEMGQGVCRAHPATPIATAQGVLSFFPTMLDAGWCGEFNQAVQKC